MEPEKEIKVTRYFMNSITLIGSLMVLIATILIIVFILLESFTGLDNPYIGMFVYFAFPGMLIFGLVLIPVGALLIRERIRKHPEVAIPALPRLDLNDLHTLRLTIYFIVSSVLFIMVVGIAAIKGYEFTESTTFCGELCHVVMEPEHTAWKESPHANVKCVECQVGPGAD